VQNKIVTVEETKLNCLCSINSPTCFVYRLTTKFTSFQFSVSFYKTPRYETANVFYWSLGESNLQFFKWKYKNVELIITKSVITLKMKVYYFSLSCTTLGGCQANEKASVEYLYRRQRTKLAVSDCNLYLTRLPFILTISVTDGR